jgi:hypothetical protein
VVRGVRWELRIALPPDRSSIRCLVLDQLVVSRGVIPLLVLFLLLSLNAGDYGLECCVLRRIKERADDGVSNLNW